MSIYVTYDTGFGIDSYQSNLNTYDEVRQDLFYNSPGVTRAWFALDEMPYPYDEEENEALEPDYDREEYRTDPDAPVHRTVAKVVARIRESIAADGMAIDGEYDLEGAVRDWITEANHNVDEPWTDRNLSTESEEIRESDYVALVEQMGAIIKEASYVPGEVERE